MYNKNISFLVIGYAFFSKLLSVTKYLTYLYMADNISLMDKEQLRLLAIISDKLNNQYENQQNTLRKIVKSLTFTPAERQKRHKESKRKSGLKQVYHWVKSDPKYKYAGADIHMENIGICQRNEEVCKMLTSFIQFIISKNAPTELVEDIENLFKAFGYE